jgi:hypothetical protein
MVTNAGVPDDVTKLPAVELTGAPMVALIQAIPELEAITGRTATVIGGLAVLYRLGTVYRTTSDLDTANRRAIGDPPQLEVLLSTGLKEAGPAAVWRICWSQPPWGLRGSNPEPTD